ncbi:TPA: hypothetical protein ACGO5G_000456 [Streptococcus suis]
MTVRQLKNVGNNRIIAKLEETSNEKLLDQFEIGEPYRLVDILTQLYVENAKLVDEPTIVKFTVESKDFLPIHVNYKIGEELRTISQLVSETYSMKIGKDFLLIDQMAQKDANVKLLSFSILDNEEQTILNEAWSFVSYIHIYQISNQIDQLNELINKGFPTGLQEELEYWIENELVDELKYTPFRLTWNEDLQSYSFFYSVDEQLKIDLSNRFQVESYYYENLEKYGVAVNAAMKELYYDFREVHQEINSKINSKYQTITNNFLLSGIQPMTNKVTGVELPQENSYGVGYLKNTINHIPEKILVAATQEIALSGLIKEDTSETEVLNMLIGESIRKMDLQEYQRVSPFLFSYSVDQQSRQLIVNQLEISHEQHQVVKDRINDLLTIKPAVHQLSNYIDEKRMKWQESEIDVIGVDLISEKLIFVEYPLKREVSYDIESLTENSIVDYRDNCKPYQQIINHLANLNIPALTEQISSWELEIIGDNASDSNIFDNEETVVTQNLSKINHILGKSGKELVIQSTKPSMQSPKYTMACLIDSNQNKDYINNLLKLQLANLSGTLVSVYVQDFEQFNQQSEKNREYQAKLIVSEEMLFSADKLDNIKSLYLEDNHFVTPDEAEEILSQSKKKGNNGIHK